MYLFYSNEDLLDKLTRDDTRELKFIAKMYESDKKKCNLCALIRFVPNPSKKGKGYINLATDAQSLEHANRVCN